MEGNMKIDQFEFRNKQGQEIEPTKNQLVIYIKSLHEKIANLEAKLAESEKEHELLIDDFEKETENLRKQIKQESDARERFVKKVEELKQQLAEKEKERYEEWETGKEWKWEWQRVNRQLEQANQDKISFAIKQLEQIINLFEPYENEEKDTILCANNGISFLEYIDQQIALLKGN